MTEMRDLGERDEKTLAIASALGLLAVIVLAAFLVRWLLASALDVHVRQQPTLAVALILGTAVAFSSLVRSRQR